MFVEGSLGYLGFFQDILDGDFFEILVGNEIEKGLDDEAVGS